MGELTRRELFGRLVGAVAALAAGGALFTLHACGEDVFEVWYIIEADRRGSVHSQTQRALGRNLGIRHFYGSTSSRAVGIQIVRIGMLNGDWVYEINEKRSPRAVDRQLVVAGDRIIWKRRIVL